MGWLCDDSMDGSRTRGATGATGAGVTTLLWWAERGVRAGSDSG
jgi:hypothetical protein